MSRSRSGHLFQGRYKAILIEADAYAKQLSRYIHMNPVRAGVAEHPEEYQWSGCRYYTLEGKAPEWLEKGFILGYFGKKSAVSRKRYRDFMRTVMERNYENPLAELQHSVILGSRQFVIDIRDRFLKNKDQDRDLPALRDLSNKPSLDHIEKVIDSVLSSEPKLARQVKLHLNHRFSGMKLREIGGDPAVVHEEIERRLVIKSR
jgi:hypothetical protein